MGLLVERSVHVDGANASTTRLFIYVMLLLIKVSTFVFVNISKNFKFLFCCIRLLSSSHGKS